MPVTPTPIFVQTAEHAVAQCDTADAARNNPTTSVKTILTAGALGSKVFEIVVDATVTTTAGMIRIFISEDGGTTKRLYDEIPVSAVTASATVAAFRTARTYDNLLLTASAVLYATTEKAEAINVHAFYGDY
jgi:hypothetical protein